jgi:hypothetical protein
MEVENMNNNSNKTINFVIENQHIKEVNRNILKMMTDLSNFQIGNLFCLINSNIIYVLNFILNKIFSKNS